MELYVSWTEMINKNFYHSDSSKHFLTLLQIIVYNIPIYMTDSRLPCVMQECRFSLVPHHRIKEKYCVKTHITENSYFRIFYVVLALSEQFPNFPYHTPRSRKQNFIFKVINFILKFIFKELTYEYSVL